MRRAAMDATYFDALYAGNSDPWDFAASKYESAKYAVTLEALPKHRYANALEVGCSIGVLTQLLAGRCDRLTSIDPAERALEQARARCAGSSNIAFARMHAPSEWPTGTFDLILLSEVIYYFTREEVRRLVSRIEHALAPGGHVELVHYVKETDYPLSGDEAVEAFLDASRGFLAPRRQERTPDYRLDVCERATAATRAAAVPVP